MEEDISKRFQERIRALRLKRGWTQEQAAENCGIGQKLYQLYELGIKANPGLLTLQKIARGYDLEVHQLLGIALPRVQVTKQTGTRKKEGTDNGATVEKGRR